MIRANLVAERVAVEAYSQFIELIGDKDSTTRRLLEDILADEQQHADELKDWARRLSLLASLRRLRAKPYQAAPACGAMSKCSTSSRWPSLV